TGEVNASGLCNSPSKLSTCLFVLGKSQYSLQCGGTTVKFIDRISNFNRERDSAPAIVSIDVLMRYLSLFTAPGKSVAWAISWPFCSWAKSEKATIRSSTAMLTVQRM